MKKSTLLLSTACVLSAVAALLYFRPATTSSPSAVAPISAYWDKKADINLPSADGTLPLIKAVHSNDLAAVSYLLKHGANPMTADAQKSNALLAALSNGNLEILNLLMEKAHPFFNTPDYLSAAINSGNPDMVRSVLAHGGNANAILEIKGRARPDETLDYLDPRAVTPLKKAIAENKIDIVAVLLEYGAEGAQYFLLKELNQGNLAMVKALSQKVGNLRQISAKGGDLLTAAASESNPEMIDFLLKENAGDVNAALMRSLVYREPDNHYNETAELLLSAGAAPNADILEFLVKKNQTELFVKAADCLTQPNLILPQSKLSLLRFVTDKARLSEISYLLKHGADMWKKETDGLSAFDVAVAMAEQNPDLFALFKSQLKDINDSGYEGETLLMLLAKNGFYTLFQQAVNEGADIWQKDNHGRTVLMYAVKGGELNIIRYLLSKGENPDGGDADGKTALMYAAEAGHADVCRELLYKGANLRYQDHAGRTAIMYAARQGKHEVVSFLLNTGESAVASDKNRKNVLMYAAESGDLETFNVLTEKGYDATLQDRDGVSVLAYAAKGNNPEIVQALLKHRADKYAPDKLGYHPITIALKNGNKQIVDMLGGRFDNYKGQTTDTGRSLPMYAFDGGNIDLIEMVIRQGRWFNTQDNQGQNFVMLMARDGRPDMLRAMINSKANFRAVDKEGKNVVMYAAEGEVATNLITVMSLFPQDNISLRRDKQERTILMYAVGGPYNQLIKQQRLLQHGANAAAQDVNGKSVLMYAVGNPNARVDPQAVNSLLHNGATVEPADNDGKTALMYAAANPNASASILELLMKAGGDIHAKDKQGKSVLMYAAEGGNITKFRLLREAGASMQGKTNDGKTVADFAQKVGPCFAQAIR